MKHFIVMIIYHQMLTNATYKQQNDQI